MSVYWKLDNFPGDNPDVSGFFSGMDVDLHCRVVDVAPLEDGDWSVSLEILDMDVR